MSDDGLSPERAIRLLRAKAHELETRVLAYAELTGPVHPQRVLDLEADVALLFELVADVTERLDDLIERGPGLIS